MFVRKTAEDLEKLYAALSNEEKAKFDDAHESTIEQVEKAEEDIAEKGDDSQTERDRIDESVAAQEKAEGDEDTQDAKDRVDEAEGEEEYEEDRKEDEEHHEESKEADEALLARVEALEGMVTGLSERLEKVLDTLDGGDFGNKPEAPTEKKDEDTESPAMRAYYAKVSRR